MQFGRWKTCGLRRQGHSVGKLSLLLAELFGALQVCPPQGCDMCAVAVTCDRCAYHGSNLFLEGGWLSD